jgi:4-hydroxy-3-methylbut-2-enyl diphosphate reductase
MRVLVLAPMALEARVIRAAAPTLQVRHTGMGMERSLKAVPAVAAATADALLVLGFCGGLDAASSPGEVVVADEVMAAVGEGNAPARARCAGAGRLVAEMARAGLAVRSGTVACVSRLALGERRAQLREDGALAVDMESVWLARAAEGRPFAVIRVVLDAPRHELVRPRSLYTSVRAGRSLGRVARVVAALVAAGRVDSVLE